MKLESEFNFMWKKFGLLTVISDLGRFGSARMVSTLCDCGKICSFPLSSLRGGRTRSCGCLNSKLSAERMIKHGFSGHPLYKVFMAIISRCYNVKNKSYHNYGGRGVRVCDEWIGDFKTFYDWALSNGWKSGMDLDKDIKSISGSGLLYSPEYCSFVSRKVNSRNKRNNIKIELNGEVRCMAEWCEVFGISRRTVEERLKRGVPVAEALIPVKKVA